MSYKELFVVNSKVVVVVVFVITNSKDSIF